MDLKTRLSIYCAKYFRYKQRLMYRFIYSFVGYDAYSSSLCSSLYSDVELRIGTVLERREAVNSSEIFSSLL
jgi:hypothetical protein